MDLKTQSVLFPRQVKELNHVLEAEKSCRTDLEMYVAVLNTQKSVLQEDAEKLRKELHEGDRSLTCSLCTVLSFIRWLRYVLHSV